MPDYSKIARTLCTTDVIDVKGQINTIPVEIHNNIEADITTMQDKANRIIDAVNLWLVRRDNQRWIMVIDNLDNLESFDQLLVIPKVGHVLITSRRPECARLGYSIPVIEMQEDEAL